MDGLSLTQHSYPGSKCDVIPHNSPNCIVAAALARPTPRLPLSSPTTTALHRPSAAPPQKPRIPFRAASSLFPPPNRPPIALTSPFCYYPPLSPSPAAHHFCDFSLRRYEIGPLASSADRVLLIGNDLYTCARFNAVRWVRMIKKKRARRTMDRILRLRITVVNLFLPLDLIYTYTN